jgi:hypothetical protein
MYVVITHEKTYVKKKKEKKLAKQEMEGRRRGRFIGSAASSQHLDRKVR